MRKRPEDWIVPDWPAPAAVRALITTRNGGGSAGPYASMNLGLSVDDDPASVAENRRRLTRFLPSEPKWLHQIHGAGVVQAELVTHPVDADACIATTSGCVSVVMIADCLPVLIADRRGHAVAACHAGWRGLARGIVENTVRAFHSPPGDLLAYLGPAIGPLAFEVGNEVRDAFIAIDADAKHAFQPRGEGKWLADLYHIARQRLTKLGVTSVYGGGWCTYSDPLRFFSHRRDKVTGRMAALIWIAD